MPLFVFLPKLIRGGILPDAQVAIEAFGKNEYVMRVYRADDHEGSGSKLV
ncbi:MAG: hypothetical protein WC295_03730 [Methanoregula sp.]